MTTEFTGYDPFGAAAAAAAGALKYQGNWDCSGGAYPAAPLAGQFWICSVAGTISGTAYAVGDWLCYNGSAWNKVNNQFTVADLSGGAETIGGSGSNGSAATAARSDHTHPITNPGVAIGAASSTTGHLAVFADTGGKNLSDGGVVPTINSQTVIGPASTTSGHLATWNNTTGTLLQDGGAVPSINSQTVIGPASTTSGHLATWNNTTGTLLADGGAVPSINANTVIGPGSTVTSGDLPSFNGTTGNSLQDSNVAAANVATMASGAAQSGNVITSAGANKTQQDSGTALSTLVVGPASVTSGHLATFNGTTGKLLQDGGAVPTINSQTVIGPASTTSGHLATWNNTTGTLLADGGAVPSINSQTVIGPASTTSGHLATWNNTTGTLLADGGAVPSINANTVIGPGSTVTSGDLPSFNGTTGNLLQDSGVLAASVVLGPASVTSGHLATFSGTTGKLLQDGGAVPSINSQTVIGPASTTSGHLATWNNTTGTLLQDGGAVPSINSQTVIGPASTTSGHLATWNNTTGTLLADGGAVPSINSQTVIGPASTTSGHLATWNNTTGTLLQDGGAVPTSMVLANLGGSAETIGGSNSNGSATTAARSDHTHGITNPGVAIGPGSSTTGHLATFKDTGGYNLSDGGAVPVVNSQTVIGPASTTSGHLATWNNTTGTLLADGGAIPAGWTIAGLSGGALTVGGAASNGSTGNAADAGHVHAITQPPANQGRWVALVAGTDFAKTAASTSTITMDTDQTGNIQPGMAVQFVLSGSTYYAQVKAITSNLLTIRGSALTTTSNALTALAYDSMRQTSEVTVNVESAWTATGASLAAGENHYLTLDLNKSHLIGWKATLGMADTGAAQPYIQPYLNGSLVTNSTQMSATPGTWVDGGVWTGDVSLTFGQAIDVQSPTLGTNKNAAKLNLQLVFVQE